MASVDMVTGFGGGDDHGYSVSRFRLGGEKDGERSLSEGISKLAAIQVQGQGETGAHQGARRYVRKRVPE